MTRGYQGLKKVTRLQRITGGYKKLKSVATGYKGLQGATRG